MKDNVLTDGEKRLLGRVLHTPPRKYDSLFDYGFYISPSVLFAVYGLWNEDFVAVLVAYTALLLAAVFYLSYMRDYYKLMHSILTKYEAKAGLFASSTNQQNRITSKRRR